MSANRQSFNMPEKMANPAVLGMPASANAGSPANGADPAEVPGL